MYPKDNFPTALQQDSNLVFNDQVNIIDQNTRQSNLQPLLCSGFGQFHTNKPDKKYRNPYSQINLEQIRELVDKPQQVDKSDAQWLIPSTLLSRKFKDQEAQGNFYLLWADIDQNSSGLIAIAEVIEDLIPGCDYEIYTSKSATEQNLKCRIIIPVLNPLSGIDWVLIQGILNDKLENNSIYPDRASERAAQLCYLPNRGRYYDSKSKRNNNFFDVKLAWSDEIKNKHEQIAQKMDELEKSRSEALAKRERIKSNSDTQKYSSLIDAFNDVYTVQDILLQAGYDQKGNTFRHPASESGSFSASVKNGRVHSLSNNDPLYTNGGGVGAHDAFSAFKVLFHDGDSNSALSDAGNCWVIIGEECWNKVKQREYRQRNDIDSLEDYSNVIKENERFSLKKFNITRNIDDMRKKMKDEVFVMDGIALQGQITALYASPNTGKTLLTIKLLIESVVEGRITGENIHYINADDTFNGLIAKADILKNYGINLIAPDHNDFRVNDFLTYLNQLINDDTARGVIVVLDTLKKFSDLMDKRKITQFMKTARSFVSHGGTLILLAHTNKRRDSDNKLVAGGTSDVVDDADCAFIIDAKPKAESDIRKTIIFENIKNRGNVERELCFSYSIVSNQTYSGLLDSIEKHTQADLLEVRREAEKMQTFEKDFPVILIIEAVIISGITKKTELIQKTHLLGGGSQHQIRSVLDRYTGTRWSFMTDAHNSKIYRKISTADLSVDSFQEIGTN